MNFNSTIPYLITLTVIAALTVLAALGKIDGTTAGVAIAGLGGAHLGSTIATPNTTVNNVTPLHVMPSQSGTELTPATPAV